MTEKLKNTSGETIAEVLIASLVVVLGVLLYATMVSTSFHIITKSEDTMKKLYEAESALETESADVTTAGTSAVTFTVDGMSAFEGFTKKGDASGVTVIIVQANDSEIKAYKKN